MINFSRKIKVVAMKPETQIKIAQFLACLTIVLIALVLVSAYHLWPLSGLLLFYLLVLATYIYALKNKKLRLARTSYRIWLSLLIIFTLFMLLKLFGSFSFFLIVWLLLGLITIFLGVGARGLTRIVEPETATKDIDEIAGVTMYIFTLFGFYCGGKIVYSAFSHWDLSLSPQLFFLCLLAGGALGGLFIGAPIGAFAGCLVSFFIDQSGKAKEDQT